MKKQVIFALLFLVGLGTQVLASDMEDFEDERDYAADFLGTRLSDFEPFSPSPKWRTVYERTRSAYTELLQDSSEATASRVYGTFRPFIDERQRILRQIAGGNFMKTGPQYWEAISRTGLKKNEFKATVRGMFLGIMERLSTIDPRWDPLGELPEQ